jgi:hypothetical protein
MNPPRRCHRKREPQQIKVIVVNAPPPTPEKRRRIPSVSVLATITSGIDLLDRLAGHIWP